MNRWLDPRKMLIVVSCAHSLIKRSPRSLCVLPLGWLIQKVFNPRTLTDSSSKQGRETLTPLILPLTLNGSRKTAGDDEVTCCRTVVRVKHARSEPLSDPPSSKRPVQERTARWSWITLAAPHQKTRRAFYIFPIGCCCSRYRPSRLAGRKDHALHGTRPCGYGWRTGVDQCARSNWSKQASTVHDHSPRHASRRSCKFPSSHLTPIQD